jgi:hypothetical protein
VAAWRFLRLGRQRDSVGLRLLAFSLAIWAVMLAMHQFPQVSPGFGRAGYVATPMLQMLIGIGMVVVLFEN